MKIRTKTFITVVLTILVLIWVLYVTSTSIIRAGFSKIEQQTAQRNVDRATQGIWDQARKLGNSIRDWSYWDESYQFIQDNNQEFRDKNLVDNVFTSLNINVLIFLKPNGEILYSKAYDFQNKLSFPISEDLKAHLEANQVLWQHTDPQKIYKGLVLLRQNKLLLASSPILNSKGEGTIAGTLIMGRFLEQPILDNLAENQQLSLSLFKVNDPQLPEDFQASRNKLVANQQISYEFSVIGGYEENKISLEDRLRELESMPVLLLDKDTVAAYSLLRDIYGKPAMVLRADMPRTVYLQGERSLKFFFLFLFLASLVFGITTMLVLERIVLSRLAKLNQEVKQIAVNSGINLRVKLGGNDELGSLAQGINKMLNALAESQLQQQESQERYQKVVEQASEGIFLIDAQTKALIEANSAFCNLLGYSQTQISGLTVYDLTNYDRAEIDANLRLLQASQYISLGERIYKTIDGVSIDVEVNANVISAEGREVFCVVVRDIRERQAALRQRQRVEDALRQSEASFRGMVEQASVGIAFRTVDQGDTLLVNQKYCDILGYSQDELMNLTFRDITHPEDIERAVTEGESLRLGEVDSFTIEKRYLKKDGSTVWGDLTVSLVRDEAGRPQNTIAILVDITARKRAEQALKENETLLWAIIDQAAVGISYNSLEGIPMLANRKVCDILGYSAEELTSLNYKECTHPEDLVKDDVGMEQLLAGEIPVFAMEKRYFHKQGHIVWASINVALVRDEEGEPKYTVAITQDISDRKRMEIELEESQIRLRATFEQASVGIAYEKFGNKSLLCNQKYCDILGYSQEELLTVDYRLRTHPEDLTLDEEYTRQLLAGDIDTFSIEKRYIRKDQTVVWTDLNLSLIRNEAGEPDYAIIVIQDISDRKVVEAELQQSQAYLQATFEQAAVGVALSDNHGQILTCNPKYAELLGYTIEEVKALSYQDFTYTADLAIEENLYNQLAVGEISTYSVEKRYVHKKGHQIWVNASISLARDAQGEPQYSIAIIQDIGDRKRIEQELRESQIRLQLTFEQAAVGIAQGSIKAIEKLIFFNQKYCDIVGYTQEEMKELSYLDITHPEDIELDNALMQQLIIGDIPTFTIEKRYIHKQGHIVWVSLTVSLVRDDQGEPAYNIAVILDISDRKKFEQQVKESEERFRAIASATPIPVFISELPGGKVVYINEAIEPMLGMKQEEIIGNTTEEFYLNDGDRAHVLQKLQEQGYIHNYELQIKHKDGHGIWVITSSRVLTFDNKPAVLSVLYDITERKWAEEALRQAEEKYRSIFENATDGIYQTSLAGELINANPALANLFGYELAPEMIYEFSESEAESYVDSNRREEFRELIRQQGTVLKFESQMRRRDGQIIWVSESAHTVYDDAGEPQFYEGMMVDITERKWAETQVNLLQSIILKISELPDVESALEVVLQEICQLKGWEYGEAWIPDTFGEELRCSQAWHGTSPELDEFRRFSSEEAVFTKGLGLPGRVWASRNYEWQQDISQLSPEQFKRHELVKDFNLGGLGVPIIARQQGNLGQDEVLAILVFFMFDAGEEDERLVQLVLAIAAQLGTVIARKQAEAALREAEERYRSIFENASEGIFQSTKGGTYLGVNPALSRIYGYESPEDLISKVQSIARQTYVDYRRREEFVTLMDRYNKVSRFESEVYRQDGSKIWVSENARAVRDARGNLLYYEGTVVDITERKIAEERLRYEQAQSERLLLNILPSSIAERLKDKEETIADYFPDVTVLFADLVGFTEIAANTEAVELVQLLNGIFSAFDALTEYHQLEKIKTIGDAYMVVGGLPQHRDDHAAAIANMAIDMLLAVAEYNRIHNSHLSMRIGINTGAVVAGVIGTKKFIYDLWGDTVNTASRMESQGIPGCIQVTSQTYEVLKDLYTFEYRGTMKIKGKGEMATYFLQGIRALALA